MNNYSHKEDPNFPCSHVKQNWSEEDIYKMSAPNAQPAGNRPGPKSVSTHAPYKSGQPAKSIETGNTGPGQGVAGHGTPAKTGANKNRLH